MKNILNTFLLFCLRFHEDENDSLANVCVVDVTSREDSYRKRRKRKLDSGLLRKVHCGIDKVLTLSQSSHRLKTFFCLLRIRFLKS